MRELDRVPPSTSGIDAAGILALLDRVEAQGLELHSLMVARGGAVVAEGWWEPYGPDRIHLFYSLTKSFVASCVGSLVDDGSLQLDQPLLEHFPWITGVDERYRGLTLRHCLNMATGHTDDAWVNAWMLPSEAENDPALEEIFAQVPHEQPGTVFSYNQRATYLLGAVVRQVTGTSLAEATRQRILQPLGIESFAWQSTAHGGELAFSGGHATTEAILRLGLMILGRGVFQGRRVLSEEWVEAATTSAGLPNPGAPPDWQRGYGFQMWMSAHGYRGDGAFGQLMLILPEHDLVVAITAETEDMQGELDAVWENLVPALDRPGSPEADAQLAERLQGLRIEPLASAGPTGERETWVRGGGELPQTWAGFSAHPADGGYNLHFAGVDIWLHAGDGSWHTGHFVRDGHRMVAAGSAGWRDGEFVADVRVLNTPHTITVRTHGDRVDLGWRLVPLSGPDPLALIGTPGPRP